MTYVYKAGTAGAAGAAGSGAGVAGGPGGTGGEAYAKNLGNNSDLTNRATAVGGAGGAGGVGGGGGAPNGMGGTGGYAYAGDTIILATSNTAYTKSKTTGGAGGVGAPGGTGGAARAWGNTVSFGSTTTVADAYGGAGGAATSGTGGVGGAASSNGEANSTSNSGAPKASGEAAATGGGGGSANAVVGGDGGAGGTAGVTASASTASANIGAIAYAKAVAAGGAGGAGYGAGHVGGSGGTGLGGVAIAQGHSVRALWTAIGGDGGYGDNGAAGGAGGSASFNNAISASPSGGYLYERQNVAGGNGGYSYSHGGAGGGAVSSLTITNPNASSVVGVADAAGGYGGVSATKNGAGGSGSATLTITSAHQASGFAFGSGGSGYRAPPHGGYYSYLYGYGLIQPQGKFKWGPGGAGNATANVTVTGAGAGDTATAESIGGGGAGAAFGLGFATANASTAAGQAATSTALSSVSTATATTVETGVVTGVATQASQNQYLGGLTMATAGGTQVADQFANAYVDASATPGSTFLSQTSGASRVGSALTTVLAGAVQAGDSTDDVGRFWPATFHSSATYTLNTTSLHGDLYLGLLSDTAAGNGFAALAFSITVGGVVKVAENFTSLSAAETYFANNAIDLGAVQSSTALKVVVSLDVTLDEVGDSFVADYLLGAGAAPGVYAPSGGGAVTAPAGAGVVDLTPPAAGHTQPAYALTANSNPDLTVNDNSGGADTVTLGAVGQSVATFGAGTTDHVIADADEAGASVRGLNHTPDVLEVTGGGSFSTSANDFNVLVDLDAASTLTVYGALMSVEGTTGGDTIAVTTGELGKVVSIALGGVGNGLQLSGGGVFDLRAPTTVTGLQSLSVLEGQATYASGGVTVPGTQQTLYLRDGLNLTVNVTAPNFPATYPLNPNPNGVIIYGANNADIINLGPGSDTVYLGSAAETVNTAGTDGIFATASTLGATIAGYGSNRLTVTGGGAATMGANITSIDEVVLSAAPTGQTQPAWSFTANTTTNLTIVDLAKTADVITPGAASQVVTTVFGGDAIVLTAATAGAKIYDIGASSDIVEINGGGSAALNTADAGVGEVTLAQSTALTVGAKIPLILGSSGADTITAGGTGETLTGNGGADTLIGFTGGGDIFKDTAADLSTTSIKNFGYAGDKIDVANIAYSGSNPTFVEDSSDTFGTLTVGAGAGAAHIVLFGQYAATGFQAQSDGAAGQFITYTPPLTPAIAPPGH